MTRLRLADFDLRSDSSHSPLGDCLLQLDSHAASLRVRPQAKPSAGLIDWQSQWSSNQDAISHRLQMIEDELNKLTATEMPVLSVISSVDSILSSDE